MAHRVVTPELRQGGCFVLAAALEKVFQSDAALAPVAADASADALTAKSLAETLEELVYSKASAAAQLAEYMKRLNGVKQVLPCQVGLYPGDVVALMLRESRMTAAQVVAVGESPPPEPDPRTIIRRALVKALLSATRGGGAAAAAVLAVDHADMAVAVEQSCYNAAVRICKLSDEPPQRSWTSQTFVDIYSSRCGTVLSLLDPDSSACRAYGACLVGRLLSGELSPHAVGDMAAQALCPQSVAAEKQIIAKRSEQKVVLKESNLFRCPHCGERRSNYREVQLRALDEAPDYHCVCLNLKCGRKFMGRS